MHLLPARLAALLSLAAIRLDKARIPLWGYHFALWKLRQEHPDAMRGFPSVPPMHPAYAAWATAPIAMAMALLGPRVRLDPSGVLELPSLDAKRALASLAALGYDEDIELARGLVAPFIAWSTPLRKEAAMSRSPADAYADILVALFSLAAIGHGHERTRVRDFHRVMLALRAEFPDAMPSFDLVGQGPFQSSNLLSDALHRALYADPPKIVADDRADLVVDRACAMRNLNAFDAFTRARLVKSLTRVADRFVALQRGDDDGPAPPESA